MKVLNTIHTFWKKTASCFHWRRKQFVSETYILCWVFYDNGNTTSKHSCFYYLLFFLRRCEPIPCHGLILWGFTITLMFIPHSVGLLRTSDQPDAETSLYLTTQHSRQTFMPPAQFEPTIPTSDRPQTHTLHKAGTNINSSETNWKFKDQDI
jgi:hypothetical protein